MDGNGDVFPIADALYLLEHGFILGSPEPPCMDAADVDDSGYYFPIVDALYLLEHAFVPDSPAPPDPGPEQCGDDPTMDELGCETLEDGCG